MASHKDNYTVAYRLRLRTELQISNRVIMAEKCSRVDAIEIDSYITFSENLKECDQKKCE